MPYEVRTTPSFAKRFKTRRRAGMEFSRTAVVLDVVPDEVANDPYLVVSKAKKGKVTVETADDTAAAEPAARPTAREEFLAELKYHDLVKLAKALEIDSSGKQDELRDRLAAEAVGNVPQLRTLLDQ